MRSANGSKIPKWLVRAGCLVVVAAMLRGSYPELFLLKYFRTESDFWGYFTAASLIRNHNGLAVYSEATENVDPVDERASPHSEFGRAAQQFGIADAGLYDYPPTLADLLVPLTFLPPTVALTLWQALNLVAAIGAAIVLTRLLGLGGVAGYLSVALFVLLFRPTLDSLCWAQVESLLLLILVAGLALYVRQRRAGAAFLFALAAAIKLTPLILIVPLLARKDWRTLRFFLASCALILAVLILANGWPMVNLYFAHEVPRMATKFLDIDNRTLGSALQIFIQRSAEGFQLPGTLWIGRLVSGAVIAYAGWLCQGDHECEAADSTGFETLAIFILFSCCLAPLAWMHAYEVGVPAIAIVVKRILEGKSNILEILLFVVFMGSASTARYTWLGIMMPFCAVALGLLRLHALSVSRTELEAPVTSEA